jgi:guanylate cyclase soluble subunit beta
VRQHCVLSHHSLFRFPPSLVSWRISAKNDQENWKLSGTTCPSSTLTETDEAKKHHGSCPFAAAAASVARNTDVAEKENILDHRNVDTRQASVTTEVSLSSSDLKAIFPYHIVVDSDFQIVQVGMSLPKLLGMCSEALIGTNVAEWLEITQPVFGNWDWPYLRKLQDQTFFMESRGGKLKGNWVSIASGHVLLILSPDVKNVRELQELGLTMSDLPLSSFQRDAVFLGEHITSEVSSSNKLDKLSKQLRTERNLSNTLLYSMLPKFVAQELRAGKSVDPKFYDNCTVLFSDVVGFTTICSKVPQWTVIDMLNRLFCIMDHLCKYFGLYKIDTIGDAFICCGGLPQPRMDHAEAVAKFAIAVQHCVAQVMDPSDNNTPIQLRIGVHTGPCVSGVVGMSTPKYTIFGDTVNCASRHESTGVPGRTQISRETHEILSSVVDPNFFRMSYRGPVEMKGKGELETYWLDGADMECPDVGRAALAVLDEDIELLLATRTFSKRQYFDSGALRRSATDLDLRTFCKDVEDGDHDDSS